MPSELDRKYDAVLAEVIGAGGHDPARHGRAGPRDRHQPAGDAACACSTPSRILHGDAEARGRRRRAASPSPRSTRMATRLAHALAGGWGIAQGRPRRDRDAQLPGLDPHLYGGAEGGRHRDPDQRLVAAGRDAPRPRSRRARADHRRRAAGAAAAGGRLHDSRPSRCRSNRPLDGGAGAAARERRGEADLPEIAPEDDATILFTSGSTGLAKGAVSTHRAVTTGVYAYAIGARDAARRSRSETASRRPIRPGPWSTSPCSTSPARCRCCSTASSSAARWC